MLSPSASILSLFLTVVAADPSDGAGAIRAEYERRQETASREPEAQVALALWCESKGLTAEKIRHLSLAVLRDPSHAGARALLGLVAFQGAWKRPEQVAEAVRSDAEMEALRVAYERKRRDTPTQAEPQWKLAKWCLEKNLPAEARAHLMMVVRLDPERDAAWKKLGYKRVDGRWVTDGQLAAERAEDLAQARAEKVWDTSLRKWKRNLDDPRKVVETERLLHGVSDHRAVPVIWDLFALGSPRDQERAVQLLGQIDSLTSSRALAVLALHAATAEGRRGALETLRRRDPREFADLVIRTLRDPVKYEVRPVGGPGSPGAIFIAGKQANIQRIYATPDLPEVTPQPGDVITTDVDGSPLITRPLGITTTTTGRKSRALTGDIPLSQFRRMRFDDPTIASVAAPYQALSNRDVYKGVSGGNARALVRANPNKAPQWVVANIVETSEAIEARSDALVINVGALAREQQRATLTAQAQLAQDVQALDAMNAQCAAWNHRASTILATVSGQNLGEDRPTWEKWLTNLRGYAYQFQSRPEVPTLIENVPLSYVPQAPFATLVTTASVQTIGPPQYRANLRVPFVRSCFGAGTPVWTSRGRQPIETLEIGDQVLTRDRSGGALRYQPIVLVHRNPPSETFRLKIGGEAIVSSHFHRFWKAGHGWVMARDLQVGDRLRTLDGIKALESITADRVQPVFNLDVATDANFFVGREGALVHDNTLPDFREPPFDAPTQP